MNLHASYEILYRGFSGNVHATSIFQGKLVTNNDGTMDIIQIRYPKDAQSVTQNTINVLIGAYLVYYKSRLPGKNREFQEWYHEFRIPYNKLSQMQYLNVE